MPDETAVVTLAWNSVLFEKFCRFRYLLTDGLARHGMELLDRHPPLEGAKVLDVGCGFGDTTRHIAHFVGPRGKATGVDCASNFIAEASRNAGTHGPSNAEFFVADVQSDALRGPYDYVFSRFGTMFFSLPGAALSNIRRALTPTGTLHFVVWRRREDNPWLHAAELCVKGLLPVVSHDQTTEAHCGPGPFSMAGPDLVSDLLRSSGYRKIGFERFDTDVCIGRDLEEAVEFALAIGPAGEIVRLAGDVGRTREGDVREALRQTLTAFQRPEGVWAPSSTWLVRAEI